MGFILVRKKAVIDQRSQVKETAKSVAVTVQPVTFRNHSENLSTIRIGTFAPQATAQHHHHGTIAGTATTRSFKLGGFS